MYRTPVKQKSAPCRACLHGLWKERTRGPKDRIHKKIRHQRQSIARQICRLFYEGCQRNARIVMRANTKRMMRSSPLSGPQKRINFSKTPTKTRKTQRKTQLFKESATPESTTPEEIGLKVDFVTGRMCFQVLSDPRFLF